MDKYGAEWLMRIMAALEAQFVGENVVLYGFDSHHNFEMIIGDRLYYFTTDDITGVDNEMEAAHNILTCRSVPIATSDDEEGEENVN